MGKHFAIASFFYGPWTEIYGRKKILIVGNIIMCIGAIGCVFSKSMNILLVSRFIQGLGAAASVVIVPIIVSEVYKAEKASKIFSVIIGCMTFFTAIAPVIGGFVNHSLGWRWNYGVIAIISVIATTLLIFLQETKKDEKLSFNIGNILIEYKTLICSLKFFNASTACNLLYGSYVAFVAYSPFLYMKAFGLTAIQYSLHQGFIVFMSAITNLTIGLIIRDKINIKILLSIGSIIMIFGAIFLMISKTIYLTTIGMSMFVCGNSIVFPIVFSYSMEIFPQLKGAASSMNIGLRSIIFSILVSIGTFMYDGSSFKIGLLIFITTILVVSMISYLNNVKLFNKKNNNNKEEIII